MVVAKLKLKLELNGGGVTRPPLSSVGQRLAAARKQQQAKSSQQTGLKLALANQRATPTRTHTHRHKALL